MSLAFALFSVWREIRALRIDSRPCQPYYVHFFLAISNFAISDFQFLDVMHLCKLSVQNFFFGPIPTFAWVMPKNRSKPVNECNSLTGSNIIVDSGINRFVSSRRTFWFFYFLFFDYRLSVYWLSIFFNFEKSIISQKNHTSSPWNYFRFEIYIKFCTR